MAHFGPLGSNTANSIEFFAIKDHVENSLKHSISFIKVRLDQCREDAGRDCVAYMANSLMVWRDSQPQNKARLRLFK